MPDTYIPIPVETVQEAEELPSKTYRLDFERKRIYGKIDGIEAVRQAIKKALLTPRFACLIYDNQYGSEIEDAIIAKDASREYTEAAAEGFVKDAMLSDTRVLSINNFSIEFEDDEARIRLTADTIFGETEIEEVI